MSDNDTEQKADNLPLTVNAYNTIKQQIIDLHLKPGEIVLAQNLAKSLGISRTPVREALVRLTHEGLVEHANGRKFRITEITLESILEMYEIREALEITAIKEVSKRCTEEMVAHLREIISKMKKMLKEKDYDAFFDLDLAFHTYIIEQHGNKTMLKMLDQLHDQVQRIRYLTLNIEGRVSHTIDEHELICRAMEKCDQKGAVKAITEHFNNCEQDFDQIAEKMGTSAFLWKSLVAF